MKKWMHLAACVVMLSVMGACQQDRDVREAMTEQDKQALERALPPGLICPPARPMPDTEGWELGHGSYRAVRASGDVIVYAEGMTPTPGYEVRIVRQDMDSSPPRLHLFWKPPPADRMVAQVLTRFQQCVGLTDSRSVQTVIIEDADGTHEVKVERVK